MDGDPSRYEHYSDSVEVRRASKDSFRFNL